MSLADYLAKNYLTADPPRNSSKKKKKKKQKDDGLVIADDDVSGWDAQKVGEDDDGPVAVDTRSAEFRKAKKSGWTKVSGPTGGEQDDKEADAIIAATAAENAQNDAEDAPMIDDDGLRMTSGARAGLQSAAQVTADIEAIRAAELARFERQGAAATGKDAETIYRDASGRIINVAMKRAELRAQAEAEEAKKKAEAEAAKGDVFKRNKEARARELENAKFMPLARGVDDVEMNEELKAQDRWNDPAAQFLSSVSKKKKKGYQGAWAPNRYNIPPGERWDGVDRSNGFEKEWFLAQNRVQRNKALDYQWQMDE